MRHGWNAQRKPLLAACAWIVVCVACAVSVPPSGGPEDKVPPTIAASVPRPDSAGVDPRSDIRIEFSEAMDRQRVERLVTVSPAIEIDRVSWDGNTLVIHPAKELVNDTTYVVRVKPDYRDRHSVTAVQWHEFAFATGSAPLDTARIEGTVTLKHAPSAQAIVRCWRVLPGDTVNLDRDRPDREATANRDGEFKLRYLPADNARFIVMAFSDRNSNRIPESDAEPSAVYADTVTIIPALPVVGSVDIALVDPNEPGKVSGRVENESGADSARVMVAMYSEADTTRATYRAVCDSTGAYAIDPVKPGSYVLRAFVDIQADSLPGVHPCPGNPKGCPEPSVRRPGTLRIGPAAEVTEPPLVIRRKEE